MRYFLFLLIPLFFSNCGKDEPILFRMEYNEEFEIEAGLSTILTHHYLLKNINTNYNNYLSTFGSSETAIMEINPGNARLDAVFSNATYDILREVSIRIYKDNPSDYLEIFYREDIPFNTDGDLQLIPTLVNVKDFLTDDNYSIDVALEFRETPPQFIETRFTFDFLVK